MHPSSPLHLSGNMRSLPLGRHGRVRVGSKDNLAHAFAVPDSPVSSFRLQSMRSSEGSEQSLLKPHGSHGKMSRRRHDVDESCLEPWRYLLSLPGKNVVRLRLAGARARVLGLTRATDSAINSLTPFPCGCPRRRTTW